MSRLFVCILAWQFLVGMAHSQLRNTHWEDSQPPTEFEVYGLASAMHTVDGSGTIVINNPSPNQLLGFTPIGLASGARAGFVWRYENVGLVADFGFHQFSDRTGYTSMAPFMAGLRFYSEENFRTAFFGEFLAGGYRWTIRSPNVNFTHVKGAGALGGGMDIRLTRHLVLRVFELQMMIVGARVGPQLEGRAATGFAYRFGGS